MRLSLTRAETRLLWLEVCALVEACDIAQQTGEHIRPPEEEKIFRRLRDKLEEALDRKTNPRTPKPQPPAQTLEQWREEQHDYIDLLMGWKK
jgi:hypothetical protein